MYQREAQLEEKTIEVFFDGEDSDRESPIPLTREDRLKREATKLGLGVRRREGKWELVRHQVMFRGSMDEAGEFVSDHNVQQQERIHVLRP